MSRRQAFLAGVLLYGVMVGAIATTFGLPWHGIGAAFLILAALILWEKAA